MHLSRTRQLELIAIVVLVYLLWYHSFRFFVILSTSVNFLTDRQWITKCYMRKQPMVILAGSEAKIVWESNCQLNHHAIYLTTRNQNASQGLKTKLDVQLSKLDDTHYLYTCFVAYDRKASTSYQLAISIWQEMEQMRMNELSHQFSFWFPAQEGPELYKEATESYRFLLLADNQNGLFQFSKLLQVAAASARSKMPPTLPNASTKPDTTSPIDSQQTCSLATLKATAANPPTDLSFHALFHLGDAVQYPFRLYDWQCYFFDPLHRAGLTPSLPILFTPGNHDCWRHRQNFYTSMSQTWMALSFGTARVIVLDSNRLYIREQMDWFHGQLASRECREASFCILLVHMAPYIEYWDPRKWKSPANEYLTSQSTRQMLDEAKRVFHQSHADSAFPIDFVISGHQHNYQRGQRDGITYAIIGGAGGELDTERVEHWNDMYQVTFIGHHYVTMTIQDRSELQWEAKTEDGTMVDSMILYTRRIDKPK